jgi:hypothetical protein
VTSTDVSSSAEIVMDNGSEQHSSPSLDQIVDELVAANRILCRQGVVDAFGHVSTRHPRIPDAF